MKPSKEKVKARKHIYSSGLAGCGGKAEPTAAKNSGQPVPCPFCDKIFKQDGRLKEHLKSKHADKDGVSVDGSGNHVQDPSGNQETHENAVGTSGVYFSKTPKMFLSEWCQKNKRPAPKYKTVEVDGGFHCRVVIPDARDSTRDVIFWYREEPSSSNQDSQNRAAVMGLHWAMGDRRMDSVLGEEYKNQWHRLDVVLETKERIAAVNEERKKNSHRLPPKKELQPVYMSEKNRQRVENLLKSTENERSEGNESRSESDKAELCQKLSELGFRSDQASMAADSTNSLSEALDWLVLNIADGDLPPEYAPGSSQALVRVQRWGAQAVSENHSRKSVTRLTSYGYSVTDVESALESCLGDESSALQSLFADLVAEAQGDRLLLASAEKTGEELSELREEECMAMSAIYGEDVSEASNELIALRLKELSEITQEDLTVAFHFAAGSKYPLELPVIAISGSKLNAGAILDLTREAASHALDLLGNCMVYDIVCFLTEKGPGIIENSFNNKSMAGSRHGISSQLAAPIPAPQQMQRVNESSVSVEEGNSSRNQQPRRRDRAPEKSFDVELESERLKSHWLTWQKADRFSSLRETRSRLPAYKQRNLLLSTIHGCSVTVVCGHTGCGKSTQVPQFLLEDTAEKGIGGQCNIVCTQPRRISAIGLADRVAEERGERVGDTVGYSIRLESKRSACTRLLFCTAGVLLRRLVSDPELKGVTHVVLDEVHERSMDGDLLLLLMRDLLIRREAQPQTTGSQLPLKLILMSATVNASLFVEYFQSVLRSKPQVITIPGFTFPIKEMFLEDALELTGFQIGRNSKYARKKSPQAQAATSDRHNPGAEYSESTLRSLETVDESLLNYDLMEQLVAEILSEEIRGPAMAQSRFKPAIGADTGRKRRSAAILVFLPGMAEIRRLQTVLNGSRRVSEACSGSRVWILPLHGSLSSEDQRRVFLHPPAGTWKVVLATNIAETSITIDDVVYVINSGRVRSLQYQPSSGVSCLSDGWASQASAGQRRGRAGRVQAGCCVHLFSCAVFRSLDTEQAPEITRVNLDSLCLQVKAMAPLSPLEGVLSRALSPPSPASVLRSIASLRSMAALSGDQSLSPLGRHLAVMPVDPKLGKLLIYGCLLRCLSPVLSMAAAISTKQPFVSPGDSRDEAAARKRAFSGQMKSDHIAVAQAFDGWILARGNGPEAEREFCSRNFLSREAMAGMEASRVDYAEVLADLGFVEGSFVSYLKREVERRARGEVHAMDEHSLKARVLKAAVCAGLYPNVVRVKHPETRYVRQVHGAVAVESAPQETKFYGRGGRVFLHPSSVNFSVGKFESPWLVYTELVQTSKPFVRETCMVSAYALLLFGGEVTVAHERQVVRVDGWVEFQAPAKIAVLVRELRGKVDEALLAKVEDPAVDVSGLPVMEALISLLNSDGF